MAKLTNKQLEERRKIFADLPTGTEPFTVSADRLKKLDPETRYAVQEEQLFRQAHMRVAIDCPKHNSRLCVHCLGGKAYPDFKTVCKFCGGTGKIACKAPMAFGCKHVIAQDAVHPCGIVYTPKLYYVCQDCWKLIQAYKFDFGTEIVTCCWLCIREEAGRLYKINPDLLIDLVSPTAMLEEKRHGQKEKH